MKENRPHDIKGVTLTGRSLTIAQVVAVARHRVPVAVDETARVRVRRCRAIVDHLVSHGVKVYGLTTGFGSKRDVFIEPEETIRLQANLIRSHAAGLGEPLPEDVVRATILLRANTLAGGNSGIREVLLDRLVDLLNTGVFPYIPSQGSLGASGDLAPLSHLALVLTGHPAGLIHCAEPRAEPTTELRRGCPYVTRPRREDFIPANETLLRDRFGFSPVGLEAKEGLALNNGTQVMSAIGVLTVYDAELLVHNAEIVCAASIEALKGVPRAFGAKLHLARPHPGQIETAADLRALTRDSEILKMPLNMALLRQVETKLESARFFLSHPSTPVTKEIIQALEQVQGDVKALERSPLEHIEGGVDTLPEDVCRRLTGDERTLRGAQAALREIKTQAHNISRSLLLSDIPETALPARDAVTEALASLEKAVPNQARVQDDYSIRCAPQVLGAARDTTVHVRRVLEIEINSATDNPLIFPPDWMDSFEGSVEALEARLTEAECVESVYSGGNFHGEPVAMAMDALKVALAEIGSISERRSAHMVDGHLNQGLPSLLVERSGLNSGFMIPQYTAAALVSENKVLAHPASVDSIPSCENTEDHVSMGTIAARQAREILHNVENVVAIECFTAYQGLHFRRPFKPGPGTAELMAVLAARGVAFVAEDRVLYPDLEAVCGLLRDETIREAVEGALGRKLIGIGEGRS